MQEMTTPPMPKKKKSKMRQRISGRDGSSAMFDTAEQTKMNEMMKKRKPRPAPQEPVEDGMMMGGKVKGYKAGGDLKMVEKNGKQVPFYAADGVGKMKAGGKVKKMMRGGPAGMYGEGPAEKQMKAKTGADKENIGMKKGGKVRGAGMAKKGVRPCKMR